MRPLVLVLQMIIRVLWVLNIVLGILFVTGNLDQLVMLHETFGILIATSLLILSILAMIRARAVVLGAAGIVIAILLPVVGMGQLDVVGGSARLTVEIIHVLVALVAIALAEMLGARCRRALGAGRGAAA
ncbi:MAG: hypothetical protein J2P44_11850 [Candidatus Dormibacteraeota bacterium]|nr:hypothetical protein [Candidatus Dormibacteraeota bacterium]